MAKTTSVYQPKGYAVAGYQLTLTDGTTKATLFTAGTDDSVIKSIVVTSTDTAAKTVELIATISGVDCVINTISVAIGAGTTAAAPADFLTASWLPLDRVSKKVLPLQAGTVLSVRAQAAVTAAKVISVAVISEEY